MRKNFRIFFHFLVATGTLVLFASCGKQLRKEDMPLKELRARATTLLKKGDFEEASEHLQLMVMKFPDDPKINTYKLSLANCKFCNQEYEPAFHLYENFHQYYPNDKRAEFAKYRAAVCKYQQTRDFERDQTQTEATIRTCKEYEENSSYQKYRTQVIAMHGTCTQKLIDKELDICKFYIKKNKPAAASKRIEFLRRHFVTQKKDLEPSVLYLEYKVAEKKQDAQGRQKAIAELMTHYPNSPYTKLATAAPATVAKPKTNFYL